MVSFELVRRLFLAKISVTLSLSVPLDVEGLQSREVLTEPRIWISDTLSFRVEVDGLQSRENSSIPVRLEWELLLTLSWTFCLEVEGLQSREVLPKPVWLEFELLLTLLSSFMKSCSFGTGSNFRFWFKMFYFKQRAIKSHTCPLFGSKGSAV